MSSKKKIAHHIASSLPTIKPDEETIAKVLNVRGGNMIDVMTSTSAQVLCDIPSKFAKKVWIKRGDYVVIEQYKAIPGQKSRKISAYISNVLQADAIKHLKQSGQWPPEFEVVSMDSKTTSSKAPMPLPEEDDELGIPANPNRHSLPESDSESEEFEEHDDILSDIPANNNRAVVVDSESD